MNNKMNINSGIDALNNLYDFLKSKRFSNRSQSRKGNIFGA